MMHKYPFGLPDFEVGEKVFDTLTNKFSVVLIKYSTKENAWPAYKIDSNWIDGERFAWELISAKFAPFEEEK